MATKKRKRATPEHEAELAEHAARFRRVMREAEERSDAYRRARLADLERRRRGWRRFIPFRGAA